MHAVATGTSADHIGFARDFRRSGLSFYDRPGSSVRVSLAGFGVIVVGGLLTAFVRRRRSAAPPPPPPWPAEPPR
ncbi:hypothetical protein GCM10027265_26990 [Jatrophihabitans fulvus]